MPDVSVSVGETPASTGETPSELPPLPPALRALIVDDEATTVLVLRRALEDAGYEVVGQAKDGREGVAEAIRTRPDLILMDYSMPGMDGIQAMQEIMGQRPVPIIMLTGHSDEEHINQAIEAGASTYLVKPINRARLLPAIRTAFDVFTTRRPVNRT
ncbi:MAG: response regulator [Capsulimonadales bacterium]|nr:response regulator [Capsulimonadales bacterium]